MTRYSYSRLDTFLKCPYAYYLNYVKKMPSAVSPAVEHGRFVHEQLDLFAQSKPYDMKAKKFVEKLEQYLEKTNDSIVEAEQRIEFMINGYNFVCVIDAITKNDIIIDYKITSNPSFYANKVGYQLPLYRAAVGKGDPRYLLFKVAGKDRKFAELKVQTVALTDELLKEKTDFATKVMEMIEMCAESGYFPPSYQGCNQCFYKQHCYYYTGV